MDGTGVVGDVVNEATETVEQIEGAITDVAKDAVNAAEYATVDALKLVSDAIEKLGETVNGLIAKTDELAQRITKLPADVVDEGVKTVEEPLEADNPASRRESDTMLGRIHKAIG
jgi:flagellar basal body rod protein FlgF